MSSAWSNTAPPAGIAGPHERPQTPAPAWSHWPPSEVSARIPLVPSPYFVCSGKVWLMSSNEVEERNVKCVGPERPDFVVTRITPNAAPGPQDRAAPGPLHALTH